MNARYCAGLFGLLVASTSTGVARADTAAATYLGVGTRFAATGHQRKLGAAGEPELELGVGGYMARHHGLFVSVLLDRYGDEAAARAAPATEFKGAPHVGGAGVFALYTFRFFPAPWLELGYLAGPGVHLFELHDDEKRDSPLAGVVVFRERLRAAWPFARLRDGTRFAIAASGTHTLVPYGHFGEAPLSGSTFGWLAEVVIEGD